MDFTRKFEKRNFKRVHHAESVHIQFKDPQLMTGSLSCDLSEGGVRVRLSEFIPINTPVTVSIRLADERMAECLARVAWVEKARFGDYYQAGLAFYGNESTVDVQQKIRGFLSHQKQFSTSSNDDVSARRE